MLPYHGLIPDFFFFNDTATTEIYTLSLHDALPIFRDRRDRDRRRRRRRARRHERAHRALHRGRRPLRPGPDLRGRTRDGDGRGLHGGRPPARPPRPKKLLRPPRGRGGDPRPAPPLPPPPTR